MMQNERLIIKTKLYSPIINRNIVARKSIEQKLERIPDYKLTVLTAPAGYGKTTTVASFLPQSGLLFAWFSLDNEDNDPVRFWGYILAALEEKIPAFRVSFDDFSVNRGLVESNILAGLVINQLDLLTDHMVLVLDDIHLITDEIIARSLTYFVQHLPDNFSLVMLSRRELDIKFTNMYSKQQVMRLDGSDLAFKTNEIEQFYSQRGTPLSPEEVALIHNFTEGWAAGLVLTSLAMAGQEDIQGIIRRISSNKPIDSLLDQEVFDQWPHEIKSFLIQTSFLERFSAPLTRAVTGLEDCAGILRRLAESNSFVIPLDQKGEWFRYHHLFKEFLQSRLNNQDREFALSLYRNAGQWYLDNDLKKEAMDAFIKGEDYKKALNLYWDIYIKMSREGQLPLMLRWLSSIPSEYHHNGPLYCFVYAYLLTMDNQLAAGQIWAARGLASFNDPNGYIENIVSRDVIYKAVLICQADMAIRNGDAAGAALYYTEASRSEYREPIPIGELNSGQPAMIKTLHGFNGRLNLVKQAYLTPGVDLPGSIGEGSAYLTEVLIEMLYERNQLAECCDALVQGMEDIFAFDTPGLIVPYFITLAKLKWANGDVPGAFAAINTGRQKLGEGRAYWHYLLDLQEASLYLDMSDVGRAGERLDLNRLSIYDDLSPTREFEYTILARYLLQSGSVEEAILLLTRLYNLAEKEDRLGSRIELLCLLAIASLQRGKEIKALLSLDKALELGMEDGYARVFIDKAEPMAGLLEAYVQHEGNTDNARQAYARQLLAQAQTSMQNIKKAGSPTATIELTRREYLVLKMLAREQSNQDIARELNISVRTVKYHNTNLYKKLQAKSRIEALIKAREAGLLK